MEKTALLVIALALGAARSLEAKLGAVHQQGWEFYAITASLFLVFAYPGFVVRYMLKRRK